MQRPAPREAYEASRAEDWRSPVNNSPHGPIEARRVGPAEDTQIRAEATRRYGDSPDAWNDRAAFQNGAGGLHPTMGMPINADRARVMAAWEDGMHYGRSIEDGSAPLPSPASPASPSAGETAGPKKPRPSTRSRQAKPVDMARYIASMGGIADDEGHSLGKGRGLEDIFVPGHGKLIRKTGGNRLDHIGETLHEAGYFGPPETTPRPSIDEVLEKIDELARRKVYRPEDVAEADAQARAEAGDQERRDRLNEIESEFRARGYELMPDEAEHVLESIARGESPSEAVDNWLTSEASLAFDEFRGETGQPKFDTSFEFGANADEPGATAARRSPEDDRGAEPPRDIGRDAEPRQEAPAGDRSQSEDAGQRDAFGTRPGDERASLERQGEGRLRSDKQQKAPGSEGGLFDTRDTTADFFKAAYVSGAEGRKTPIPKGAITDGPLRDTLDWIRTNSKDEFHRDLAERLADLSEHVELRIVNDANFRDAPAHIHETYGFVAHHDREARVFINDTKYGGGLNEETVLHEAIHAAIATRFGKLRNLRLNGDLPPGVNREARRLWAIAQQSRKALSEKQGRSGLPVDVLLNLDIAHNNLDEFLTYALTDRGVASWLNSVKSTEATANVKPLTLWQHVVNLARRIVGLAPKYEAEFERIIAPHSDLLSQVDDVANNMLDHLDRIEPKEPTGKLDQALQYEFARKVEPGDEKKAKGRLLDIAFHPDAVDDAAKLVGTLTKSFGSPKGAWDAIQTGFRKAASPLLYSNDGRLRAAAKMFDSPTLDAIADIFHAEGGKDRAVSETYHEAVHRETVQSIQKSYDAVADLIDSPAAMLRVRDLLTSPTKAVKATEAERQAARAWRDILKERLEYRRAAGEDIGSVDNYFRRQFSPEKIVKNAEGFKKVAAAEYGKLGVDNPEAAAEAWFKHIFDTYAGVDGGGQFATGVGGGMGSASAKTRVFGPEGDQVFKDFLEDDVWHTMTSYLSGAARRAEQTRRFGKQGAVGSPERAEWERQHKGKTQWDVQLDKVREEVIASGREASGVMHTLDRVYSANLGQYGSIPPRMRATISGLHAWTQLRTMDRATFSSLADMTMGFVRGGPRYGVQHLSTGLNEFVRHVRRAPPSEATRYAEALGVANDAIQSQTLYARASMDQVGNTAHKIIDRYHRAILLKQWTDGMRVGAMKTGQRFIADLADDLASSNAKVKERATFYLKELGVQKPEEFGLQHRAGSEGGGPQRATTS
jgi:hypothetical protein